MGPGSVTRCHVNETICSACGFRQRHFEVPQLLPFERLLFMESFCMYFYFIEFDTVNYHLSACATSAVVHHHYCMLKEFSERFS